MIRSLIFVITIITLLKRYLLVNFEISMFLVVYPVQDFRAGFLLLVYVEAANGYVEVQ